MAGLTTYEVAMGAASYFTLRDATDRHGRKITHRLRRLARKGDMIELDDEQAERLLALGAIAKPGSAATAAPVPTDKDGAPIVAGDYEQYTVGELRAEADRRGLVAEGTGTDGNVRKGDLVKALETDDQNV